MESPVAANDSASHVENNSLGFLSEVTKHAILGIFALYSVGFLIWHSFLGQFGTSPSQLLRAEYISGALCYLFLVGTLAIPTLILYFGLVERKNLVANLPFWVFTIIWIRILSIDTYLFFPGSYRTASWFLRDFEIAVLVHLGGLLVGIRFGKDSKLYQWMTNPGVLFAYALWFQLDLLFRHPSTDDSFILSTLFLCVFSITGFPGGGLSTLWSRATNGGKFLAVAAIFCMATENVVRFGSKQFGKIPRNVGGGKPELALLKPSSSSQQFASTFGLGLTNSVGTTNQLLCGPVLILLRSEKELIFVRPEEYPTTNGTARIVRSDLVDALIFVR